MRIILTLLLIVTLTIACVPAMAQRAGQQSPLFQSSDVAIVAVVNDKVISTADVRGRLDLTLLSAGLPNTAEMRKRLAPQILNDLIDEQLQLEHAREIGITISKNEIEKMSKNLAKRNNIPGTMDDFLTQHNISPTFFNTKLEAEISWSKVIQRELRPRIEVADDEVTAAMANMRKNAGKQEFLVSEIFLATADPANDDNVAQLADNIATQIKQGADFTNMASQFSQTSSAKNGGDIGWVQAGVLPKALDDALTALTAGDVTAPIQSNKGYHILLLRDKRIITADEKSPSASKESITNAIGLEKLEVQARRLLRDLRRAAYIDKRMTGL